MQEAINLNANPPLWNWFVDAPANGVFAEIATSPIYLLFLLVLWLLLDGFVPVGKTDEND